MRWTRPTIELFVSRPTIPPDLELREVVEALTRAAQVWSAGAQCGVPRFVVRETDEDRAEADGVNVVAFRRRAWCKDGVDRPGNCYDARRAAVTTLHFEGGSGAERIAEADVEVNAVNFHWGRATGSGPQLSPALAHELGHVLGFGHPCAATGERPNAFVGPDGNTLVPCKVANRDEVLRTLMSPSAEPGSLATLSPDDLRGVCDVYGTAGGATDPPHKTPSGCGCMLASLREQQEQAGWFIVAACILFQRKALKRSARRRCHR